MVAYWYPRLAVYDDVVGWQNDPYLGAAEFYMGYADYDVNLTVPQGWLVAATGELSNPNEILSKQTRDRLADARRSKEVVHVVREQDRGSGTNKATMTGFDRALTWRFRARNVRDFDWGASPNYLWDATVAVVGDRDGDGKPDSTRINTFYRPSARKWSWDLSGEYERSVVEFLSNYLWPYPWPQMTALEGPVSCAGMEYPMLTCIGGARDTLLLYSVQVHETGHMWFPMQVGSDERRYAWQDEGLTRFNQAQGMQAFFKGYDREGPARESYLDLARTDGEVPLMRPGDQYPYDTRAYSVASYDKMATNMRALRALARRFDLSRGVSHVRSAVAVQASDAVRLLQHVQFAGRPRPLMVLAHVVVRDVDARSGDRRRADGERQAGRHDRGSRPRADARAAGDHAHATVRSSGARFPSTCG